MPNQLKKDPTRTTTLQKQFMADMRRRFKELSKNIQELVVDDDAFGLDVSTVQTFNQQVPFQVWRFRSDSQKVQAYHAWLTQQVNTGILTPVGGVSGQPWTAPYIESAYKKGAIRAYTDLRKKELASNPSLFEGGRAEFVRTAFNQPIMTSKIELLYNRAFTELQGVTAAMDQQMSRILAEGLSQGQGPRAIARSLRDNVTKLTNTRAITIARTEIVRAHAEGQLDAFEFLGVEEVGILAEWSTAGDELVCPLCEPLEGVVMTVKEARGLIPRHPNCRCAWIPANKDRKEKGQLWGKDRDTAVKKSIQAEGGENIKKRTKSEIRRRSVWSGKDLNKGIKAPSISTPVTPTATKVSRAPSVKKVESASIDQFGARFGTKKAKINEFLGTTPASMKEIAAKAGLTPKQISGHINDLVKKGLLQKGPKGFFTGTGATPIPKPIPKPISKSTPKQKLKPKTKSDIVELKTAEDYRQLIIDTVEETKKVAKQSTRLAELEKAAKEAGKKSIEATNKYFTTIDKLKATGKYTQAKDDALWQTLKKIRREGDSVYKEIRSIQKSGDISVAKQRKLLNEIDNLSGIMRKKNMAGFDSVADDILSWIPKNRVSFAERRAIKDLKVFKIAHGDCTANPKGIIEMASWGKKKGFAHEFGHHLSFQMDDVLINNNRFYNSRTVGDRVKRLKGYDITGKRDNWKTYDTYAGREYGGSPRYATPEPISVGMETIWKNPYQAAKKDPEWFNWLIGQLKDIPVK